MDDQKALAEVKSLQEAAKEVQIIDLKLNAKFEDEEAIKYQQKYREKRLKEREELIHKIEETRKKYYKYRIGTV